MRTKNLTAFPKCFVQIKVAAPLDCEHGHAYIRLMQLDRSTGYDAPEFTLDRQRGGTSLYIQVAREMERQLLDGVYPPGELLPSEPALAAQLGVSRATIIRAFDVLSSQGMIERRQGKGTFALRPPSPNSLTEVTSFSTVTSRSGSSPSHRLLDHVELKAGRNRSGPAAAFPANEPLVKLERVRFTDEVAVGHHVAVVPKRLCVQAEMTKERIAEPSFSLYAALEAIDEAPDRADESLRAVACPPGIAEKLGISEGEPMMRVRRLTRNRFGHLIEVVDANYLGSLYEYQSRMASVLPGQKERSEHAESQAHGGSSPRDISVAVSERLRRTGS